MEANLTDDLTLGEVLVDMADARERALGVALPGIVVTYDSEAQTATVQPAVNRLVPLESDPDEDLSEPLPALQSVPVMWPRGRNFAFEGELLPGDPVLLVCIDRDISGWRSSGAVSDPQDARTHDWSSAVAIPGLVPAVPAFVPAPTDAAALASVLATLLAALSNWNPTGVVGDGPALKAILSAALPVLIPVAPGGVATPNPALTCASEVLLLGG